MSEIVWLARTVKNHLETKSFTSIGTMAALITIAGDRAAAHPLESLFLIGLGIAAICEKPNASLQPTAERSVDGRLQGVVGRELGAEK